MTISDDDDTPTNITQMGSNRTQCCSNIFDYINRPFPINLSLKRLHIKLATHPMYYHCFKFILYIYTCITYLKIWPYVSPWGRRISTMVNKILKKIYKYIYIYLFYKCTTNICSLSWRYKLR